MGWFALLVTVLLFIVASFPLYLIVKLIGGKTSILHTAAVAFISGMLIIMVESAVPFWGGIVSFILLLWVFKAFFHIGWWRAFLVWVMYGLFLWLIGIFLGITPTVFPLNIEVQSVFAALEQAF